MWSLLRPTHNKTLLRINADDTFVVRIYIVCVCAMTKVPLYIYRNKVRATTL